jgi:hypothetical protein
MKKHDTVKITWNGKPVTVNGRYYAGFVGSYYEQPEDSEFNVSSVIYEAGVEIALPDDDEEYEKLCELALVEFERIKDALIGRI